MTMCAEFRGQFTYLGRGSAAKDKSTVPGITLPEGVPATHQERAYTSPIWYTP